MDKRVLLLGAVLAGLVALAAGWLTSHPSSVTGPFHLEVIAPPETVRIDKAADGIIRYTVHNDYVGRAGIQQRHGVLTEQAARDLVEHFQAVGLVGDFDQAPAQPQPYIVVLYGDVNSRKFAPAGHLLDACRTAPHIGEAVKRDEEARYRVDFENRRY